MPLSAGRSNWRKQIALCIPSVASVDKHELNEKWLWAAVRLWYKMNEILFTFLCHCPHHKLLPSRLQEKEFQEVSSEAELSALSSCQIGKVHVFSTPALFICCLFPRVPVLC